MPICLHRAPIVSAKQGTIWPVPRSVPLTVREWPIRLALTPTAPRGVSVRAGSFGRARTARSTADTSPTRTAPSTPRPATA